MLGNNDSVGGETGQRIALVGLAIYVLFAPHSVAASAIGVALAGVGWVLRTLAKRRLGLRWSKFDLIIVLSLLWTVLSSLLSEEPRISVAKLQASWSVLLFYLARATLTRKSALVLVVLLVVSGSAGALYSAFDLLRGRGVVVESIADGSPLHQVGIRPGDTIWQINRSRVYSTTDIDQKLAQTAPNTPVVVGLITQGEQVERSFTLATCNFRHHWH